MSTATTASTTTAPTIKEQSGLLLGHAAGYVGHRTIAMGLRTGLIRALAAAEEGVVPRELADRLGLDPFYVEVWAQAAVASGFVDREGEALVLGPFVATLLLDDTSPAYAGALFTTLEQPEVFGRFEDVLATGERLWWEDTRPEWIASVAATGAPFYTRLVPGGLSAVPGLDARLSEGCVVVDTACGSGRGLERLAQAYPACRIVGVDGDAHSIDMARQRIEAAGLSDRVSLEHSPLEEMDLPGDATLVINNISMHECRDIDAVTAAVRRALEPGGWFVISDFPFPADDEGLRTIPGRVMSGIQFFEAQIDDQLLPRAVYDDLLDRHGFEDLGNVVLTPVHALTWGRA